MEKWGQLSTPTIAKNLNRSVNAIKVRVTRLGLGPSLMAGDYITLNQPLVTMGNAGGNGYKMKSWVENRGLPVHTKKVGKREWERVMYCEIGRVTGIERFRQAMKEVGHGD